MDDPIFETSDEHVEAEAGSSAETTTDDEPTAAKPAAVAPAPTSDPAVEARMSRIEESLQGMGSFFQSLQSRMEQIPPQGAEAETVSGDPKDWNTRFYEAPEDTVRQTIDQATAGVVGPAAKSISNLVIAGEAARFDGKWGTGAWDNYIKPTLGPILTQANPAQLLNQPAIENAVGSILARNIDDVLKYKAEHAKTDPQDELVRKTAEMVMSHANLTGGFKRPTPEGSALSLEDKEILKAFEADTGEKRDEKSMAALMSIGDDEGTTLEQYEQAMAKFKPKSNGAARSAA